MVHFSRRFTHINSKVGMTRIATCLILTGVALTACSRGESNPSAEQPKVPGKFTAAPVPDTDNTVKGNGAPTGYLAQLDIPEPGSGRPSYTVDGHGRWEVRTGPAHIVYANGDTAHKRYSVTATFEQVESPAHPEAYGIFIGGSSLDTPKKQQYTYFLVRGDGKYMIKVRNGDDTRIVTEWTAHPAIPHQDASGKAVYGLRVDVDGAIAKFRVNGQPVTMISDPKTPLQGIAGLRINHNLHLMVTRLQVIRS